MSASYDDYGPHGSGDVHETVGAYVLGVLDDAEASAFEAHLAGCELCARQLEEFAGMEPMLAALADIPEPQGTPARERLGAQLGARPSDRLAGRLFDEVAQKRARKRRRGMYLVAAAAALIVGGPLTVLAVNDGGTNNVAGEPHPTSPAQDAFFNHMDEKVKATDPATKVTATIGMEKKAWGTHTVLELKNVKGPLTCSLVAVGKNGQRETVTTWAVPKWGYGIPNSKHEASKYPLYVHGGAAFERNAIDHFEVETLDGKRLVEVDA
ncbi:MULTISPECIES: anti-sigma factor [unclassified Streptomyces]|uniref:anti-sigma factor family protein n=1 Tax=unclassified Streptomyces TaxID=2593676 RepID=UPI002252BF1C|nr:MULTISPECIES: zf-HC2 domain-containing protein [unclassified Streptomyces]MCX5437661.1 zf-HC2 domain-containing protein [Streptomyces sp. NBC_00063]WSE15344.1 zf-HC2 domain-containing protein [Streptomyces sp. NBC_01397]